MPLTSIILALPPPGGVAGLGRLSGISVKLLLLMVSLIDIGGKPFHADLRRNGVPVSSNPATKGKGRPYLPASFWSSTFALWKVSIPSCPVSRHRLNRSSAPFEFPSSSCLAPAK